jgi:hypothetical protein
MRNLCPGRSTELLKPFEKALDLLSTMYTSNNVRIPTIVLITDGSTPNEYAICKLLQSKNSSRSRKDSVEETDDENLTIHVEASFSHAARTKRFSCRVFAFGIGPYCNSLFLTQLATIGHGCSQVCYYQVNPICWVELAIADGWLGLVIGSAS